MCLLKSINIINSVDVTLMYLPCYSQHAPMTPHSTKKHATVYKDPLDRGGLANALVDSVVPQESRATKNDDVQVPVEMWNSGIITWRKVYQKSSNNDHGKPT